MSIYFSYSSSSGLTANILMYSLPSGIRIGCITNNMIPIMNTIRPNVFSIITCNS